MAGGSRSPDRTVAQRAEEHGHDLPRARSCHRGQRCRDRRSVGASIPRRAGARELCRNRVVQRMLCNLRSRCPSRLPVRSPAQSASLACWRRLRGSPGASGRSCSDSAAGARGGRLGHAAAKGATDTASASSRWARSRGARGRSGTQGDAAGGPRRSQSGCSPRLLGRRSPTLQTQLPIVVIPPRRYR
jgi:hypothetical protein